MILVFLITAAVLLTIGVERFTERPAMYEIVAGVSFLVLARVYAELTRRG